MAETYNRMASSLCYRNQGRLRRKSQIAASLSSTSTPLSTPPPSHSRSSSSSPVPSRFRSFSFFSSASSCKRWCQSLSDYAFSSKLPKCIVCLEGVPRRVGIFAPARCPHLVCIPCLRKYVQSKLQDGNVRILCAEATCGEALTPEMCEPVLSTALNEKWSLLLVESTIPERQRVYCPFKDCSAMHMMESENQEMTSVECPSCHRLFCVRCMVPWHADISCTQYQTLPPDRRSGDDELLHGLAKRQKWRRCSECKHLIELNTGCRHMTCRCGNQFCYECGAKWTSSNHQC